jgi:glyoxylase-like metal-dependent hydrolase (beta-lactamase superfamily II)
MKIIHASLVKRMGSIKKSGKIDENTILIDGGLKSVKNVLGIYYIHSEQSCLIDAGLPECVKRIHDYLNENELPFPDNVILTHAHSIFLYI